MSGSTDLSDPRWRWNPAESRQSRGFPPRRRVGMVLAPRVRSGRHGPVARSPA